MRTTRILTTSIAVLLLAPAAFGLNFTWDGGSGVDSNIGTPANWNPDGAPLSDPVNTNLFFDGTVRLTPNFAVPFSANGVTFNNNAAGNPFTFTGSALTIGTTGVVNNDANTAAFGNQITLGTASTTFNAASGALTFNGTVALGTSTLNVNGAAATTLGGAITGTGLINKTGAGTLTLANTTISADVTVGAGSVTINSAGTTTFDSNSTIAINAGTFTAGGSLTLDGAQLSRANSGIFTLSAGKTLTVQNGGDAIFSGGFSQTTAATINVAGVGSTFSLGGSSEFRGGSTLNITAGGSVANAGSFIDLANGAGNATVLVDGAGSSFSAGLSSFWGHNGNTALVTFSNGSSGSFGSLIFTNGTAGSAATLNVQSGSSLTTGPLTLAPANGAATATVSVTGAGSSVTQSAGGSLMVGAASLSTGTLNVQSGGTFNTSATFTATVNATGTVAIAGGTFNANGNMMVNGGQLTRDASGVFNLAAGKTLTVQSAGDAIFTGAYATGTTPTNGANLSVIGTGSTLQTSGNLAIISGSVATVQTGGTVSANSLTVGTLGAGTFTVGGGGVFTSALANSTVGPAGTVEISGGTFNANGNLTVNGGQLTRSGSGALLLASDRTLTVQAGGDVVITGLFQQSVRSNLTVSGSGSSLTTTGDFQWDGTGNTLSLVNVNTGGLLSSGGALHLGRTNQAVSMTVNGAGAQIVAAPSFTSEWQAGVLLVNGASATLGGLRIADEDFNETSFGTVGVQSGSTMSLGTLAIATTLASSTGSLTIEGTGSAVTQTNATGPSALTLGAAFVTSATLSVENGGAFTSGTGAFTLNATGVLNVDAGTATFHGLLADNGGTVNFTNGALLFTNSGVNLTVGNNGLLGENLALPGDKRLLIGGTTTIEPFRTLTLNGGSLTTGALVNNGTLAFSSGTLAIAGAGGFNIGTGALGSNVSLGAGANLLVTNTATVAGGATLTLNGGAFTAGALTNSGTIRANLGTTSAANGTNASGGRIFIGDTLDISGLLVNASGGRITLESGSGLLSGAGTLSNNGLVTGDGTIAKTLVNNTTGEVRGELGRTLSFTAAGAFNSGVFNLVGGTLDFTGAVTHNPGAFISGHGALFTGGLTNQGQMAFSGGTTDIRGDVTNAAGARIVTSGGSTTTFYDDVIHNGAEIRTSAGGASVFLGAVSGAGPFTGTGTVYFEGDLRPGNSPADVTYEGDLVFGGASSLTLEIGGLRSGDEHDHLDVAGTFYAAGLLTFTLLNDFVPETGDTFDVLDVGTFAGDFYTIEAPDLPDDQQWDFSGLKTTGTITVVPEPESALLALLGVGLLGLRRRQSH